MNAFRKSKSAFSLIELMVVIVIVGVLAAVAVPYYKSYILNTTISKSARVVESLVDRSVMYAATHGIFGSAGDLGIGLAARPDYGFWDVPDNLNPIPYYLSNNDGGFVQFADTSAGYGNVYGPCGKRGTILLYLDASKIGDYTGDVFLMCTYWHINGVIKKLCSYENSIDDVDSISITGWTPESDAQSIRDSNDALASCQS